MLGLDLVGLNPDYAGKTHTEAFLPVVDAAVQERFNSKVLGVWPAGPQVIFCKPEIGGLSDLEGLKVRVGDQSAAAFVGQFGATGIPLPFGEVQQSLARGVVDCAITGPSSANSAGWPEVTTTVLPIALQLAVNGYAINLDSWNKLDAGQQDTLQGGRGTARRRDDQGAWRTSAQRRRRPGRRRHRKGDPSLRAISPGAGRPGR